MSPCDFKQIPEVVCEVRGRAGLITLNRPRALNALSLDMVRALTAALRAWRDDPAIDMVALRGMGKSAQAAGAYAPFGAFCAGGDIRFFHQAALAGDPRLEDFFTEEYALNHLVHRYPKPYVVFLDGIVMGGGMGIAGHGAEHSLRLTTLRTQMAMPETQIGLFPDVGGGWFLGRCPGRLGEYLALTGQVLGGADAVAAELADALVHQDDLPALWDVLAQRGLAALATLPVQPAVPASGGLHEHREAIDRIFALADVPSIVSALQQEATPWAQTTASALGQRSPLMLQVVLEQLRRARSMTLAEELRMERGMVRQCFQWRPGLASETVEGIRALAIDKDHHPRWNPAHLQEVTPAMVAAFFDSPWPDHAHPLRDLV